MERWRSPGARRQLEDLDEFTSASRRIGGDVGRLRRQRHVDAEPAGGEDSIEGVDVRRLATLFVGGEGGVRRVRSLSELAQREARASPRHRA